MIDKEKILDSNPSDADALFSLGSLYYRRNQLENAHDLMAQAIALKNNVPLYHNDLGLVFYKQRKNDEAIQCYREALRLDDRYALAYYNLGCLYRDQGKIDEAIDCFEKAFARDPLLTEALTNLLNVLSCMGADDAVLAHLNLNVSRSHRPSEDRYHELVITSNAMIISWKRQYILECAELAEINTGLRSAKATERNKNYLVYFSFISKLAQYYNAHETYFFKELESEPLYVFGDSHCLSYANLIMGNLVGKSELIMGIKMWHLTDPHNDFFRFCLKHRLQKLPKNSHLLFTIGEIDCRPDEGIWKVFQEGQRPLTDIIETTVTGYVRWLRDNLRELEAASVTLSGIPAPAHPLKNNEEFTDMIGQVNRALHAAVKAAGWRFLDVYALTADENGYDNGKWRIDSNHVQPGLFYENFISQTQ